MKKRLFLLLIILLVLVISGALLSTRGRRTLKIYCCGSMLVPLGKIAKLYEKAHPDVKVEIEGHGSIQVIRHVTELNCSADLLIVADYSLIPVMMYNKTIPGSEKPYSSWYIRFARNEVVLAFTNASKYAKEVNAENWYEILERPDVTFGMSNPVVDACGYRTLMMLKLAEIHYGREGILDKVVADHFDPRISTSREGDRYIIEVPEVLIPVDNKVAVRSGSVFLIALLETHSLDYAFQYLSVAEQHHLKYIKLPPQVNLGDPSYDPLYSRVKVVFSLRRFATVSNVRIGGTVYYGLTIPNNAKNPDLAIDFVRFMLTDGKKVFEECYQPLVLPPRSDHPDMLPQGLRDLVVVEDYHPPS